MDSKVRGRVVTQVNFVECFVNRRQLRPSLGESRQEILRPERRISANVPIRKHLQSKRIQSRDKHARLSLRPLDPARQLLIVSLVLKNVFLGNRIQCRSLPIPRMKGRKSRRKPRLRLTLRNICVHQVRPPQRDADEHGKQPNHAQTH